MIDRLIFVVMKCSFLTYGSTKRLAKRVVAESLHKASLSDARVAYKHDLEDTLRRCIWRHILFVDESINHQYNRHEISFNYIYKYIAMLAD